MESTPRDNEMARRRRRVSDRGVEADFSLFRLVVKAGAAQLFFLGGKSRLMAPHARRDRA